MADFLKKGFDPRKIMYQTEPKLQSILSKHANKKQIISWDKIRKDSFK